MLEKSTAISLLGNCIVGRSDQYYYVRKTTHPSRILQIHYMGHIFLISDRVAIHTCDNVFGINTKQLSDWCSSRSVFITLSRCTDYVRIVGESVTFQTEVIK